MSTIFNTIVVEPDIKTSLKLELLLKTLGHNVLETLDNAQDVLLALEDHLPDLVIINTENLIGHRLSPLLYFLQKKEIHVILNNNSNQKILKSENNNGTVVVSMSKQWDLGQMTEVINSIIEETEFTKKQKRSLSLK